MRTLHLRVSRGEVAPDVIVCGDPHRVDLLSGLLEDARVVGSFRGFKVVTGLYEGHSVSIASHGIGGPSAAIVFEELRMAGAERIVRLGSAGALRRDVGVGRVVVATGAGCLHGGCALGQYAPGLCLPLSPDPLLTSRIIESLESHGLDFAAGPVFSSDAFYTESTELAEKLSRLGFLAIEMETATLFALGWMRGFKTASVLVTCNTLVGSEEEKKVFLTTAELSQVYEKVARAILRALAKKQNR